MPNDVQGLVSLAQEYFEAAYEMDADRFAAIFDPSASVTRRNDQGSISVVDVASWLDAVRTMSSPQQSGATRRDEVLSIDVTGDMALLKLRLRIPPRIVTDMLICFQLDGRWQIVQKVFSAELQP